MLRRKSIVIASMSCQCAISIAVVFEVNIIMLTTDSIFQLIKTSELNPNHNYLLGFHPHGVLVAGAFGNFCTGPTFKNLFPGLTPYLHIMPIWFGCPFFREYVMSAGR